MLSFKCLFFVTLSVLSSATPYTTQDAVVEISPRGTPSAKDVYAGTHKGMKLEPKLAVDGKSTTMYHGKYGTGGEKGPFWFQLAFEKEERICGIKIQTRRYLFLSPIEVRAGNTPAKAGLESTLKLNTLCGRHGRVEAKSTIFSVLCDEPIVGKYLTLESAVSRFEFAEVWGLKCMVNENIVAELSPRGTPTARNVYAHVHKGLRLVPKLAIDGNPETIYHGKYDSSSADPPYWFQLALDHEEPICGLKVQNRNEFFLSPIEVRVGNTPATAATKSTLNQNSLCGRHGRSEKSTFSVLCNKPIIGKYITLESAKQRFEFAEVWPLACAITEEDVSVISPRGTPSAKNVYVPIYQGKKLVPQLAVDGNPKTIYHGKYGTKGEKGPFWFQLAFNKEEVICGIKIQNRDEYTPNPKELFLSPIEVRAGNTPAKAGMESTLKMNTLCATHGRTEGKAVFSVICNQPIVGKYLTLESAVSRFEFAEVWGLKCN